MKKAAALILSFILVLFLSLPAFCDEEDIYKPKPMHVITNVLRARYRPDKSSTILTEYVLNDILYPTGKWSWDRKWIEAEHSEFGKVWVSVNYVTERTDIFTVYTLSREKIKVRSSPGVGKVTKYIRTNEPIEITQAVMGYGRCKWGWVDLGYFIEDCE